MRCLTNRTRKEWISLYECISSHRILCSCLIVPYLLDTKGMINFSESFVNSGGHLDCAFECTMCRFSSAGGADAHMAVILGVYVYPILCFFHQVLDTFHYFRRVTAAFRGCLYTFQRFVKAIDASWGFVQMKELIKVLVAVEKFAVLRLQVLVDDMPGTNHLFAVLKDNLRSFPDGKWSVWHKHFRITAASVVHFFINVSKKPYISGFGFIIHPCHGDLEWLKWALIICDIPDSNRRNQWITV